MQCQKCQSIDIIKSGFTKAGSQRYRCKDCGAGLPIEQGKRPGRPRKPVGQCPYCQSDRTRKSGGRKRDRACCYDCGKTFKLGNDEN